MKRKFPSCVVCCLQKRLLLLNGLKLRNCFSLFQWIGRLKTRSLNHKTPAKVNYLQTNFLRCLILLPFFSHRKHFQAILEKMKKANDGIWAKQFSCETIFIFVPSITVYRFQVNWFCHDRFTSSTRFTNFVVIFLSDYVWCIWYLAEESLTCNVCDRAFRCHRQLASHQQKKRHFG